MLHSVFSGLNLKRCNLRNWIESSVSPELAMPSFVMTAGPDNLPSGFLSAKSFRVVRILPENGIDF